MKTEHLTAEKRAVRTAFIDYDARREPRTSRYCVCCQKDLKSTPLARMVYIKEFPFAIHPEDVDTSDASIGTALIGSDCAKKIGIEFTMKEIP